MLNLWDTLIACAAMLGIIATALGTMLQIIEVPNAMRHIGLILGCALLLTILPPIIVRIWLEISIWQKLGILVLIGIAAAILANRKQH